jgi:chromosome segregation ATPase
MDDQAVKVLLEHVDSKLDLVVEGLAAVNDHLAAHDRQLAEITAELQRHSDILIVVQARLDEHDRRFDEVDKRFDAMDRRFDEHDRRFDEHDRRFDDMDRRFDRIDLRLDEHDRRFDTASGTEPGGSRNQH